MHQRTRLTLNFAAIGSLTAVTMIVGCGESSSGTESGPREVGKDNDPVVRVDEDDPRMVAASKEARSRWPEFVAAFSARKPNTAYAVKSPFPVKSGGVEHIWIQLDSITGRDVTGKINNVPTGDIGHSVGDTVTIKSSEISDWMIANGPDNIVGGFQVKILEQIQKERGQR